MDPAMMGKGEKTSIEEGAREEGGGNPMAAKAQREPARPGKRRETRKRRKERQGEKTEMRRAQRSIGEEREQ